MLTERAIRILSAVLYYGCNVLKIYPYVWDPINFCLEPAPHSHLIVFNFHRSSEHFMALFSVYRLLNASNWGAIPDRQRVLHVVWIVAHCLSVVCFIQFKSTRTEIMNFINSLWAYILKHRGETIKTDVVSACVIFGGFILFINGPSHGTGMIEIPCTPHFISSLAFPCRQPDEDVEGIVAKIPYFLIESYFVTMVLFLFAFNWAFVFLGLSWIRRELRKGRLATKDGSGPVTAKSKELGQLEFIFSHYRTCQRINNLLNESFQIYLKWFPTFLLGLISLLLFATLKLWYIPIHAYLLFPACSLRCFFETMTPLAMAGKVNEESIVVLRQWSQQLQAEMGAKKKHDGIRWLQAFHRSCPKIVCTAGSLYTFENSIVLCTLNNCVQLTMNLLLMSNKRSSSVSESLTSLT